MLYKKRETIIIDAQYILAPIWKRALAFILDFVIIFLLYYLVGRLLPIIGLHIEHIDLKNLFHVELESSQMSPTSLKTLKIFLGFLPAFYFCLMFYFTNGRTFGKLILGIKIVSLYHQRIGFWHCAERSLGYAASVLEAGLGFFQAFWNPNRMALHDKIAETIVINVQSKKVEIIVEDA